MAVRGIGRLRATVQNPPTLDLSFLISDSLDSRITASGGANGTRVNSAGTIVAATTPRFDYNPTTLAAKGLLVEEARTNLLLNSTIDGASLATQSVTVTAAAHTLTFYGTGTVTLSGVSTAGPLVGSGAYPTRSTLTFTPTAGSLTLTVTGTVQFAQLELGSFATSYIPTAGATVTRTADALSMTGANFSSWFNASAGTFVAEADTYSTAANRFVFAASDATVNEEIAHYVTTVAANIVTDGSAQGNVFGGTIAANTVWKNAFAYAANDLQAAINGTILAQDTSATLPTVDRLTIGRRVTGVLMLNGHMRSLRYYSTRLPDATLQTLTV